MGLGAQLGNGRQWMSWIHIDDHVGAIRHLIDGGAEQARRLQPDRTDAGHQPRVLRRPRRGVEAPEIPDRAVTRPAPVARGIRGTPARGSAGDPSPPATGGIHVPLSDPAEALQNLFATALESDRPGHADASRAWEMSAMMSSTCSIPMESRTMSRLTPCRGQLRIVRADGGWSMPGDRPGTWHHRC